jgi:septal ring factor EnvC (AmiA/AmiB activator)
VKNGLFLNLFWLAIFLVFQVKAYSASSEALTERVQQERRELKKLQAAIEEKQRKRREAERKVNSILSSLDEIDDRLRVKRKELILVDLNLKQRDRQLVRLQEELAQRQEEIDSKKDAIKQHLRFVYKEGRKEPLRLLFSATDPSDLFKRYQTLVWISQRETMILEDYSSAYRRLAEKESEMKQTRTELLKDKAQLGRKLGEIELNRRKKTALLASVKGEKATYQKMVTELEDAAGNLRSLIEELERQRKATTRPLLKGFARERGRLPWPSEGDVISSFGKQKHPRFDAYIFRKGIEIRSDQGNNIHAVYGGTVVYGDWLKGYGLLIILDHGENYYSLYAHAEKLLVGVGDKVRKEQVIGQIGDTGFTGESSLYFEIRRGSDPVDPVKWLQKR